MSCMFVVAGVGCRSERGGWTLDASDACDTHTLNRFGLTHSKTLHAKRQKRRIITKFSLSQMNGKLRTTIAPLHHGVAPDSRSNRIEVSRLRASLQ
jgi:hypothetical protein